jgi:hypothetical protein
MSKPDWSEAPSWAEWLAQDKDGTWTFFNNRPQINPYQERWEWEVCSDGSPFLEMRSSAVIGDWRNTLEQRPQNRGVLEQLKDLEDRLGEGTHIQLFADGSGCVLDDLGKELGVFENVEELDSWVSNEPPEKVEPGTMVLLNNGSKGYVFQGVGKFNVIYWNELSRCWFSAVCNQKGEHELLYVDWAASRKEGLI